MTMCVVAPGDLAPASVVPMATSAVFALLLGSLNGPDRTTRMHI